MRTKAIIVVMWGIALGIILNGYYRSGNSGLPNPRSIAAPSYLYGVLAISSEFLEGLPVVLAVGLTAALFYRTNPALAGTSPDAKPTKGKPNAVPKNKAGKPVPQTRKVK
jgi:chromate transport protein ChrA